VVFSEFACDPADNHSAVWYLFIVANPNVNSQIAAGGAHGTSANLNAWD
jgi:hypothetical protein